MDDETLLDGLLYRGEGDALDFKKMQYPFEGGDDKDKSELLKDILAFANAWRDGTAYIVVGVSDDRELVGLDKDIDDSRLQQFVNSKVNRPIRFNYRSLNYRGKIIGLYAIPLQERPFYLVKNYGRLAAEAVYVRRGSATALAKPDEIAKMGSVANQSHGPRLLVKICDENGEVLSGANFSAIVKNVSMPSQNEIPDYIDANRGGLLGIQSYTVNSDYFREVAEYIGHRSGLVRIRILIENVGDAYADDVKLTFRVPASEGFRLITQEGLENKPSTSWSVVVPSVFSRRKDSSIEILSTPSELTAIFGIGKIHAGDRLMTADLYLSQPPAGLMQANVTVHADQLKAPLNIVIPLSFEVQELHITGEQLKEIAHRLEGEDISMYTG